MPLAFSIITPSYNMLDYLKRCCRSVADQEGVGVEHIVIDGGSTDGTAAWLAGQAPCHSVSEPDEGMYDALNKGLDRAQGDLIAYLNCDEQYLPGTLRFVADYFERHPHTDVLFGDFLLIRPDGSLLAYRKAYQPRWYYILASHLYVASCTMFFRRSLLDHGLRFNDRLRVISDQDFVVSVLEKGYTVEYVRRYLAAFTMTGANLSEDPRACRERRRVFERAPGWVRYLKYPLNAARLTEKFLSGAYRQEMPLTYALYATEDDVQRSAFTATTSSSRWPS